MLSHFNHFKFVRKYSEYQCLNITFYPFFFHDYWDTVNKGRRQQHQENLFSQEWQQEKFIRWKTAAHLPGKWLHSRTCNHVVRCLSEKPLFEFGIHMDSLLMSFLRLHNVIFGKYFQKTLSFSVLPVTGFVLLGSRNTLASASQVVERMNGCGLQCLAFDNPWEIIYYTLIT